MGTGKLPEGKLTKCLGVGGTCNRLASHPVRVAIGHFTVVCLVAKPLIWSEAEGDLVVLETRI